MEENKKPVSCLECIWVVLLTTTCIYVTLCGAESNQPLLIVGFGIFIAMLGAMLLHADIKLSLAYKKKIKSEKKNKL